MTGIGANRESKSHIRFSSHKIQLVNAAIQQSPKQ